MLRSFLGPFAVTFPVALFILDMQFLWLYADELIGKGLDAWIVFKLMVYASARLVNLALPLAVLVASIMALGNLSERSELTALKASGMSLNRILRPLVMTMVVVACGALWFSNKGWPAANIQFRALLYSVTKQKPALNIREGVFYNGIEGFAIRVGTKHPDGSLEDILIHDHRDPSGQSILVLKAAHGSMKQSDGQLILTLEHGVSHEEHQESQAQRKQRVHPHISSSFSRQSLRIPLHSLDFSMANEDLFRRSYEMMTLEELAQVSDSLQRSMDAERVALGAYGERNVTWLSDTTGWYRRAGSHAQASAQSPWFAAHDPVTRGRLFDKAKERCRNHIRAIEHAMTHIDGQRMRQARHDIEWHRKYILALSCLVLFVIGASLGALIGRGGLGLPTVLALGMFMFYYILSMLGEQMVKAGKLQPGIGMWLSTLVLAPMAFFMYRHALKEVQWLRSFRTK